MCEVSPTGKCDRFMGEAFGENYEHAFHDALDCQQTVSHQATPRHVDGAVLILNLQGKDGDTAHLSHPISQQSRPAMLGLEQQTTR